MPGGGAAGERVPDGVAIAARVRVGVIAGVTEGLAAPWSTRLAVNKNPSDTMLLSLCSLIERPGPVVLKLERKALPEYCPSWLVSEAELNSVTKSTPASVTK